MSRPHNHNSNLTKERKISKCDPLNVSRPVYVLLMPIFVLNLQHVNTSNARETCSENGALSYYCDCEDETRLFLFTTSQNVLNFSTRKRE